jgi:hypothetical protein
MINQIFDFYSVSIEGDPTTQQSDPSIVQEDAEQPTQLSEPSIVQEDEQLLPPISAVEQPSALTERKEDDDHAESADLAIHRRVEGEILFI